MNDLRNTRGNQSYDTWRRRHAESRRPEPPLTGVDKFIGVLIVGGITLLATVRTWWAAGLGLGMWLAGIGLGKL